MPLEGEAMGKVCLADWALEDVLIHPLPARALHGDSIALTVSKSNVPELTLIFSSFSEAELSACSSSRSCVEEGSWTESASSLEDES